MHYDVIISGAGMAGMTLAVALTASGFSVMLLEKSLPKLDERTTALNYQTKMFFEKYNIWKLIQDQSQPILDIFTVEGRSTSYLHYDHKIIGGHPMGYVTKNHAIRSALDSFNMKTLAPATYQDIDCYGDKVEIKLSNNDKITTDLFICAEGKHSKIYELLNIKRIKREYGQSAIVCNVEHVEDHQGTAQERFYPTGPFALLPLKGKYFSSLIWSAKTSLAQDLMNLSQQELIQKVNKHCNFHITKVVSEIQSYPISMGIARRYYKNRILLIGDVMQSIHPIAGQGFNSIVRCIDCLITNIQNYGISEKALKVFSKQVVLDNLMMAGATHSLVKLFSNDNKLLKPLRKLGLNIIQELTPLKRKLVNYAMGKISHTLT